MPLNARRSIKKLRGGAQAHLLEADDGRFYVVKVINNPQHRRVLVNELIASVLLEYLQIPAPPAALINLTPEFLAANPDVYISLGSQRIAVPPGWHYGSRHPGDPAVMATYDYMPDALLRHLHNLRDFLGALVFDKWTANANGRQCLFYRARLKEWGDGEHPRKTGFVAQMIDQGYAFDGPQWHFPESPIQGLYSRLLVYEPVRSLDDFQPWLDQVLHLPDTVIDRARKQVPPDWTAGDDEELDRMLEKLYRRRKRAPDLIHDTRRAKSNPFPNWR